MKPIEQAHIHYAGKVYRPAGFRNPLPGEPYMASTGHVKIRRSQDTNIYGCRMILRDLALETPALPLPDPATPSLSPALPQTTPDAPWVAVEDRLPRCSLPPYNTNVLIWAGREAQIGFLRTPGALYPSIDRWETIDGFSTTPSHWMPLPAGPRDEADGNEGAE